MTLDVDYILKMRVSYSSRNGERRLAMKYYMMEEYEKALEVIKASRKYSLELFHKEPKIVLYRVDYILDTVFYVRTH